MMEAISRQPLPKYRLTLERVKFQAYHALKKHSITVVYPRLCKEWHLGEDDFDKIVNLIDYYFLLERVCHEIQGNKAPNYKFCRRFRHSRCRCEYMTKLMTKGLVVRLKW
jgi:hypothetical protein